jgi:hypothetical protein
LLYRGRHTNAYMTQRRCQQYIHTWLSTELDVCVHVVPCSHPTPCNRTRTISLSSLIVRLFLPNRTHQSSSDPPPGCGGRAPHCVAANVLLTHVVHLLGHPLGLQHPKRCVLSLRFSCPQHILEQVPAAGPGGDSKQHMQSLACRRAEARGRCNGDREQQLVPHSAHTTSARCVDSGTPLPGSERSWPGE